MLEARTALRGEPRVRRCASADDLLLLVWFFLVFQTAAANCGANVHPVARCRRRPRDAQVFLYAVGRGWKSHSEVIQAEKRLWAAVHALLLEYSMSH
ncbi:hypothetical protein V5799_004259 [Amblyomma americanum]|uniref:Secreted protein n=1 Tax=Amblyomma americanum TaxID=6943 RepID=A0AAQ4D6L9_AMBAM